jgi:4-amino-4-deoxy-L-arabinose transferase-like glycosyltransferase
MTSLSPPAEQPRSRLAWEVLGLIVLAGWLVGVHLGDGNLGDPDEPRSALVMRQMLERGDWLAPHLPAVFAHDYPRDPMEGGLLAYWDKPPLGFWLGAAAMKVLIPGGMAARLPAALSHVAAVLVVYFIGRLLWGGRAGFLAGAVLATAPLPLALAHIARMDSLLVACIAVMFLAILRLAYGAGRQWVWTLVLGTAGGLGLLTKGLEAAAIPIAACGLVLVLARRLGQLRWTHVAVASGIALVVAAPWYAYMHLRYPAMADGSSEGFLYEFLWRQHFGRAMTGEYGHSSGPPGALLGITIAGLLPWAVFLPAAIAGLARQGWRERRTQPAPLLLLAWAAVVVGVFSLTKTQLSHYVAPAFPTLALMVGAYLAERLCATTPDRWFRRGLAVTTVLGGILVAGVTVYLIWKEMWSPSYLWAGILMTGAVIAGLVSVVRNRREAAVGLLITGLVVLETFLIASDPLRVYATHTTRAEARLAVTLMRPGDEIIAYPYTPYSLAWYFWPREVKYPTSTGSTTEPSYPALVAELNKPRRTFCVLQKRSVLDAVQKDVRWPIKVLLSMPEHTLFVTEPPQESTSP